VNISRSFEKLSTQ